MDLFVIKSEDFYNVKKIEALGKDVLYKREDMKKYLTRKEELVLLAIFRMEEEAYLVNVRQYLNSHTGKRWTVGNVYVALDRMNKLGFLNCYLGPPNAQRGGKAVQYYKLSRKGYDALLEIKKVNEVMWEGFNRLVFEE